MRTVLLSAAVSLLFALFGTPVAIKLFTQRGYGQEIRSELGAAGHLSKRGTPTMGGTVIITASLAGYLVGHLATGDAFSASGLLVLFLMTGLGLVGFIDDFIKLYMQRSLGLRSGAKLAGQAIVGGIFAVLAIRFPDGLDITPASTHLSFYADFGPPIGIVLFVVWVILMVSGTSNAVNLTDGLDGLAITTHTELLLFLLGGLFVIITLSVVIQVGSFKLTGKRVFRMAPLQHHFELTGWAETTIVVRFWIIAGICVALGLGIFYVG